MDAERRIKPPPRRVERDRFERHAEVIAAPRLPVQVVLDNVRSAFNVGSIFRTSDAARVERLHLCGITARPPHRRIARVSLGATRYVPWMYHARSDHAAQALRHAGVRLVVLETHRDARSYAEADYTFPMALVLGHEVVGVSPAVFAQADEIIAIPMWGIKNSMNVATAYGIVIFEILRRLGGPTSAVP
jgi:tRNA G18 (ribose-2'-O)-methylase SpoU